MQAYTIEKIEPSAISSGARLDAMLREMEALFAARFGKHCLLLSPECNEAIYSLSTFNS